MPDAISYLEHPVDVLSKAVDAMDAGQDITLVTSIDIKGGAARETGSLAVVRADGHMFGYMSNGCIDQDIRLQALQLLQTGAGATKLRYGEGSNFKDLVLPCGGALELLLQPRPDPAPLRAAHAALRARRPAHLIAQAPEEDHALRLTYDPKPRLVLAGRGAVFRATVEVSVSAGFEVSVFSPEADDLTALERLPVLHRTALTTQDAEVDLGLDPYSAFLTLFHDHDWEPSLLRSALRSPAAFIGSLGSIRSHEARLAMLRAMGEPEDALARLTGPIGLVPSLRNAQAIAVSTVAQMVAVFPKTVSARDIIQGREQPLSLREST